MSQSEKELISDALYVWDEEKRKANYASVLPELINAVQSTEDIDSSVG